MLSSSSSSSSSSVFSSSSSSPSSFSAGCFFFSGDLGDWEKWLPQPSGRISFEPGVHRSVSVDAAVDAAAMLRQDLGELRRLQNEAMKRVFGEAGTGSRRSRHLEMFKVLGERWTRHAVSTRGQMGPWMGVGKGVHWKGRKKEALGLPTTTAMICQ